ncbi:DNA polymerase III delta prime subunit [Orbus hercynius]|uniref:DNA polymerase III subunit delta' n=1 Tax=Orbus hercynius TaxID=593135 RepID=A0A495RIN4_9GAMM|nr:DNA polymerase III subunit delta' [Orbus hercynius]RKS87046.1 DNA polymerase III delta prime subunit [Orbus hercynius]
MESTNSTIAAYPWLLNGYRDLTLPLNQGRAHHARLIHYLPGSGEDLLMSQLAMRLLCLTPKHNQPCQQCHHCQLFLANNHPDYDVIEPEKNKLLIGVDQIRQITKKIYERAQQGGNKVIWIKAASQMTEAAANALLKTLEEPPENTYFLLSDKNNGQLLPTIRSRCQFYFLAVPDIETSISWLKTKCDCGQYNDNQLATALLLSCNAPLAALSLLTTECWQAREQFNQQLQHNMMQKEMWALREILIHQDNIFMYLDWFCTLISDALKAKQKSGRFIINRDQVPLIRLIATYKVEKIIELYERWQSTRKQLATITSLNQDLIISNLLAQSEIILYSSAN